LLQKKEAFASFFSLKELFNLVSKVEGGGNLTFVFGFE